MTNPTGPVTDVLAALQDGLDALPPEHPSQHEFLATYRRTTQAVGAAIGEGLFEDPGWVAQWDAVFGRLYLDVLDARLTGRGRVPRPWCLAFDAPPPLPPLRHVLLGINAHVNYARLLGPEAYAVSLAGLELLSAARIADLLAPGQVLLRLAFAGLGVVLPPPD